ncbi:hypothetical protein ACGFZL_31820 [Streptomyces sp. NPDC048182]|uniref:hypothetical protein n=1 Tax=Streptomyces sp. NPDC048182 TaxID=3365507 RepID=UPI00371BAA6C
MERYTPLRSTVLRTALLIPFGLRGGTVVRVGLARAEGGGVGEPGAWGEVTAELKASRPVLVARLLELDADGALTTAHVRAGT